MREGYGKGVVFADFCQSSKGRYDDAVVINFHHALSDIALLRRASNPLARFSCHRRLCNTGQCGAWPTSSVSVRQHYLVSSRSVVPHTAD